MSYIRTRRQTGLIPLTTSDTYGRRTLAGVAELLTPRRLRKWASARNSFYHQVKNGIFDPLTMFHLVEELANTQPNEFFTAAELAEHLNRTKLMLRWDAVTVGRILNDLIESWREANPDRVAQPLVELRRSTGREYMTTSYPYAREVLLRLIDDLVVLGRAEKDREGKGEPSPRLTSPLASCRSLVA
ncbi:MAG: hypothetical protein QOH59_804 [Gemmatimonadales bacterium]|jgi:hypothetical protein|nr:hypothetical protein [Gemmatimonadales bacterium]